MERAMLENMPTNQPLLSIITIHKDDPSGLKMTWKSLSSQSSQEFEWIIVDGASKEQDILRTLRAGRTTKISSKPDRGIYDAMNKGVIVSRGSFLIFMNAGDTCCAPVVIENLTKVIESRPDVKIFY